MYEDHHDNILLLGHGFLFIIMKNANKLRIGDQYSNTFYSKIYPRNVFR